LFQILNEIYSITSCFKVNAAYQKVRMTGVRVNVRCVRIPTWRDAEPRVAEFAPIADSGVVVPPQPVAAPVADGYPRDVSGEAAVDPDSSENVLPIRETVQQPEFSGDAPEDEKAADLQEDRFDNPLSTMRPDDEDIDIPEPVTAGMNRPDRG